MIQYNNNGLYKLINKCIDNIKYINRYYIIYIFYWTNRTRNCIWFTAPIIMVNIWGNKVYMKIMNQLAAGRYYNMYFIIFNSF